MNADRLDPTSTPYPERSFQPWGYREDVSLSGADLAGYKVEATDGAIGHVDEAGHEVNANYIVVDTGPWIFGKKVLLPAGTINHVDHDEQRVYVDRTRDQVKAAPEFDPDMYTTPEYRDKIGGYYGETYADPGARDGAPPPAP
jgi:hypothetical protein